MILGVVAIGGFIMLLSLMNEPLKTAVDQHFALIQAGNERAAYDGTAVDFQATISYGDFQEFQQQHPVLKTVTGSSFSSSQIENDVGILEGNLIVKSGTKIPIAVQLKKEVDEWKIVAYKFPKAAN